MTNVINGLVARVNSISLWADRVRTDLVEVGIQKGSI
jgi:hypothetical protein